MPTENTAVLDFSLFDRRVPAVQFANNARWAAVNSSGLDRFHVVQASDYFVEPARSAVRALLGAFEGRVHRSIETVGGTIDRHPAQVTVGSGIHCCDLHSRATGPALTSRRPTE